MKSMVGKTVALGTRFPTSSTQATTGVLNQPSPVPPTFAGPQGNPPFSPHR